MAKNPAITLRLSEELRAELETRATRQHRSLSAQIAYDLDQLLQREAAGKPGRFLGIFEDFASSTTPTPTVPTDEDIQEVRKLLWGTLGRGTLGRRA